MDTKNNTLKKQIYTPLLYQKLLSIILVLDNVNDPLENLKNVLAQVYQPFEVIVINNSSDATYNILSNHVIEQNITNVHIFHSGSSNVYECLNIGLQKSLGNYIVFQVNEDTSSHLRFAYQMDALVTQKINPPQISLCLTYSNGTSTTKLKSMCFTRSVFHSIGYFLTEYQGMCFDEYLWRYLVFTGVITKDKDKTLDTILDDRISSVCIVQKVLLHDSNNDVVDAENREKLVAQYNNFHKDNTNCRVTFNGNEPRISVSYLDSVLSVLKGKPVEHRVTLVYFMTSESLGQLTKFYEHFQCNVLPSIICYPEDMNINIDTLKGQYSTMLKHVTFKKVCSYADGYYKVMNTKMIETPYVFILRDCYTFLPRTLLHPLSYIIDYMDKLVGDVNSVRFGSEHTKDCNVVETCEYPRMVYTTTFTDEPSILNVRHASMFFKPYINKNARGDMGVSDALATKYRTESIGLKLKMCIYGGPEYPPTCTTNDHDKDDTTSAHHISNENNTVDRIVNHVSFLENHLKRMEIKRANNNVED